MIVVSDTSPIFYLLAVGAADVLPKLYGEVIIPPAVFNELCHPAAASHTWSIELPGWVRVLQPDQVDNRLKLDRGEREAIALAIEWKADLLLVDEKLGREAARLRSIKVAGTLGVLLDAALAGLIDFDAAMDRLRQTTFYVTEELLDQVRAEWQRRKDA